MSRFLELFQVTTAGTARSGIFQSLLISFTRFLERLAITAVNLLAVCVMGRDVTRWAIAVSSGLIISSRGGSWTLVAIVVIVGYIRGASSRSGGGSSSRSIATRVAAMIRVRVGVI